MKPYALIGRSIDLTYCKICPHLRHIPEETTLPYVIKLVTVDRQVISLYSITEDSWYNPITLKRESVSQSYEINSG